MPVPKNPNPEQIDYQQARRILAEFYEGLAEAEATLAQVKGSDVRLPLRFGLIRLDLDGDGVAAENEKLWRVFARVFRGGRAVTPEAGEQFTICFDAADLHWLRGYCHMLSAFCDISLAYDWSELFERTGHIFFSKIKSPYSIPHEPSGGMFGRLFDEVALVHLIRFPVEEPARLKSALNHFQTMIQESRLMWKAIRSESDNDREWIPGPGQTGVIPGVRVTEDMVDAWHRFLDEAEALLAGEKLVPFWRKEKEGWGVNIRRAFTEPNKLDLVLWMHGSAALPYLEKGTMTSAETWTRLQTVFGGEFIGFVVWFN